jgi:uncharacterized protein (TIGR00369 family)
MSQVFDARGDSDRDPHVVRRLGLVAREVGDGLEGRLRVRDDLRVPGSRVPLLGPIGSFCDTIGGVLAAIGVYPTPVATADLTVVLDPSCAVDTIVTRPSIVRAGRTSVITEMLLTEARSGARVGYCLMSSTVLTDAQPQAVDPRVVTHYFDDTYVARTPHFYDELGIERDDRGGVAMNLAPYLGNTMGMMHGGVTVMLAEAAALEAARDRRVDDDRAGPVAAVEAQVRYLNGAREGPVRATATVIASTPVSVTCRVEQHDEGRGRLTSVAVVRVDTAPEHPRN